MKNVIYLYTGEILEGKIFGKWKVLERVHVIQKRSAVFAYYLCECVCGTKKNVRACDLRRGRSSQCTECSHKKRFIDTYSLVGTKQGNLTVLNIVENHKLGQRQILIQCNCGKEYIITATRFINEKPQSCHICNVKIHGYEGSRTYNTWRTMKARCHNEKNDNFKNYGGRGIKVCDRWKDSFATFLEDMGECPTGLQLDRINNDGNYEPGNCRWVTPKENSNNRGKKGDRGG